jgi:hypothetical protein
VDSSGNVYFAELTTYRVRKVSIGGILSTAAGCDLTTIACILAGYGDGGPATGAFMGPFDVQTDSAGNFYIADDGHNTIRKVNSAGILSTFAGNSTTSYSGDGGPATKAGLNGPLGISIDSAGN